jgi:hypothetical protein
MLCGAAGASIVHDEALHGDLSNDGLAPTRLAVQTGINTLVGGTGAGDRDYLFLDVPAGSRFEALYVRTGTTVRGAGSFIGVHAGNVFPVPPDATSAAGLLGWRLYARSDVDTDILPLMGAAGDGASGFTPPLPAGAYAFWIQELGQATTYRFDFEIAPVPEPSAWAMLLAGLVLLGSSARRLRRA